jgi:hypothetical protein
MNLAKIAIVILGWTQKVALFGSAGTEALL